MALNASVLEKDIVDAFLSMTDGDNKVFSQKISAAIKKFAESGTIATVNAGTVPAGVYAGAGTGGITVDESVCEEIIYAACIVMKNMSVGGNEYLAMQMASGIHAMIATGQVETDVRGTVTPPSSPSVTLNGSAVGTMVGVPLPMQTAFAIAYLEMNNIESDGDDYMAKEVSMAVNTYMRAAVINTSGSGALAGSVGVGAMT